MFKQVFLLFGLFVFWFLQDSLSLFRLGLTILLSLLPSLRCLQRLYG